MNYDSVGDDNNRDDDVLIVKMMIMMKNYINSLATSFKVFYPIIETTPSIARYLTLQVFFPSPGTKINFQERI